MAHDHHHHLQVAGKDGGVLRRLGWAVALTALVLIGEVVGALWTGSLALLSDAAHVFTDLFALGLALGALLLSRLPASDRRTFGWHRAEVIAALVNGVSLFVIAVLIFKEAVERLQTPTPVKGPGLLAVAAVGLVANVALALTLRGHVGSDLNVRAAFLHIIGDAAASVAVVISAVVVIATGWFIVDAILALAIGLLLLWGAGRLVRDAGHILLEGTPPGVKPQAVAAALAAVEGVAAVHDVHIWALCSHINNLSAHLVVPSGRGDDVRRVAEGLLQDRFAIQHTTLQIEEDPCSADVLCTNLNH